jgi:hypothetical protein
MTAELTCPHFGQVISEIAVYEFAAIVYSRRHLTTKLSCADKEPRKAASAYPRQL